jgi:hypothetical protein
MSTRTAPLPRSSRWPLERVLFAMAGTVTLLSALLAAIVSPWFLLLTTFVGLNQWLFVVAGDCPASLVFRRLRFRGACDAFRTSSIAGRSGKES